MWQHFSDSVPDNHESRMSVAYADSNGNGYSHGNINANSDGHIHAHSNGYVYANSDGHIYAHGNGYIYADGYGYINAYRNSDGYGNTDRDADADSLPMAHKWLLSAGGHAPSWCSQHRQGWFYGAAEV